MKSVLFRGRILIVLYVYIGFSCRIGEVRLCARVRPCLFVSDHVSLSSSVCRPFCEQIDERAIEVAAVVVLVLGGIIRLVFPCYICLCLRNTNRSEAEASAM